MKHLTWVTVFIFSLAVGQSVPHGPGAQASFTRLVLAPSVSDNLALLFSEFETEVVLCLEGERRGSDLYISDFRMPHILLSETGRVQASACKPGPRNVGTWHNHPAAGAGFANAGYEGHTSNCYLSRTDITDFRRRKGALVTVVSCAPHTYAYWQRPDIDSELEDIALLPPPAGQLIQSQTSSDAGHGNLTQARTH